MQGKTVVITGGTSGIGEVAAIALAKMGACIVLVARSRARGEETLAKLKAAAPGGRAYAFYADLSSISEMKRVAAEIAASESRIDVLINNAGALFNRREVSVDGLEMTFATNHMAYFVVTNGLLDTLLATPGARIVSTASDAHKGAKLDFDDLQSEKSYSGFGVYGKSKLCNILFTRELARVIDGSGVTANCLHPGFVATRFGDNSGGVMSYLIRAAKPLGGLSPEKGAETIVYLASSPDVAKKSGGYYYKNRLATPTREAQNDADAKRLWDISAKLAGIGA
jgi:NAD(P)-dependent dehydrogenase (short-subunit alcohol dehydrogenase family)